VTPCCLIVTGSADGVKQHPELAHAQGFTLGSAFAPRVILINGAARLLFAARHRRPRYQDATRPAEGL
jgi:hypothetical protein